MDRSRDWWVQAEADLRHAENARRDGTYEWACFAAHQAAEKALKAVFEQRGQKVWGHTLTFVLQALQEQVDVPPDLFNRAKILDKHYIPTRYPNSLEQGAPTEFYTKQEADDAIRYSEEILQFCDGLLH
ncbi:HEPN domain-containing protein [Candidatus Bipolaricaulota bacterium]|nr:HEPN domain-containing protein [Candidatus Bipolaricaulota bacterium]